MTTPAPVRVAEPMLSPARIAADLRAGATSALARRVSPKYLDEHCLVPLSITDVGELLVAAGGPLDPTTVDELAWTYERTVRVIEAPAAEIHAAIMSAQSDESLRDDVAGVGGDEIDVAIEEESTIDDLRALANQTPVIKLVNVLILEALRARASDIHLEAGSEGLRVRYRIDGVLQEMANPPRQYQAAVISRVKIMAALNIAERRLAQDGRIRLRLSDRDLDLRVSITPTLHGESVVLRILDRGIGVRDLSDLGLPSDLLQEFEGLIRQPHGIVLVTGPTGSGKTTTLYGAIDRLNRPGVKIVTVEDPVEYQIAGVTQIPVNPKIGLTFAAALRSILRHDPDIIMVGEMRDREAADIAIQAALTGHVVFSTLHTNDAPAAVTRMIDMGIEPYLVAATVLGIIAQRLVRVICDSCAVDVPPSSDLIARASAGFATPDTPRFRRGQGCEDCAGTGYRGRTGLYELMPMTAELRDAVVRSAPLAELRALALARGTMSLRAAGWAKACAGETTLDEVLRATRDEAYE